MKPIEHFKNTEQFLTYAEWWRHKLFLDDWLIKFKLIDDNTKTDSNTETDSNVVGMCNSNFINKEAVIIVKNTDVVDTLVTRNIAELNLVHELLHIKFEYLGCADVQDEELAELSEGEQVYYLQRHQALEQMAKTLLSVKYDLDFSYFDH